MSDQTAVLLREFESVIRNLSPWVTREEMMRRYSVKSYKTLQAMQERGEIPTPINGKWSRVALVQWESQILQKAA